VTKPPRTELVMTLVLTDAQWRDLTDALSYAVLRASPQYHDWAVRVAMLAHHLEAARAHATRELMPDTSN
jgi:hypothetical protein